jgi:hypothetical protein
LAKFSVLLAKLFHSALIGILLLSSSGVVVNKHYCQDELRSVRVFAAAEPCHQGEQKPACPFHPGPQHSDEPKRKGCCDDTSEYVKVNSEQSFPDQQLSQWVYPPAPAVPPTRIRLVAGPTVTRRIIPYRRYKPPLIVRDFQVELQRFLC